eukprot:6175753-Pleurochrysis_carterae.AAC.2
MLVLPRADRTAERVTMTSLPRSPRARVCACEGAHAQPQRARQVGRKLGKSDRLTAHLVPKTTVSTMQKNPSADKTGPSLHPIRHMSLEQGKASRANTCGEKRKTALDTTCNL